MSQQTQGSYSTLEIREAQTTQTVATVESFCDAFNRHDIDAVMTAMTSDCVVEGLTPYPDGARCEGQAAVKARW